MSHSMRNSPLMLFPKNVFGVKMILKKASPTQAQLLHSFSFRSFCLSGKGELKILLFNQMLRTGVVFASSLMPKVSQCKEDFRRGKL